MTRETPGTSGPEHYEGQDLEALADLPHYYQWILGTFAPHVRGRVLEVGAGIGNFAAHYVHAVDQAILLEPARNLYEPLAARFAQTNHVLPVCGLLEDWCKEREHRGDREAGSFDAIVLVNVLEHIEDDAGTVRRLGELLRPGGALLVFVPALQWLYGSLDARVQHFRRYSFSGLAQVMAQADLELVHLRYFDLLGVLPWFVTGRVLRQRRFSPTAARTYDRLVVPVAARMERWLKVPLGKNLIGVARKPEDAASRLRRAA